MNSWSKNDNYLLCSQNAVWSAKVTLRFICSGQASHHPRGKFWCKVASFRRKSSFAHKKKPNRSVYKMVKKKKKKLNRKKNDFFFAEVILPNHLRNWWFLSLIRSNVNLQKIVIASSKFLKSCRFIFVFRKRTKVPLHSRKSTNVNFRLFVKYKLVGRKMNHRNYSLWSAPWNSLGQLISTSKLTVSCISLVSSLNIIICLWNSRTKSVLWGSQDVIGIGISRISWIWLSTASRSF